MRLGGHLAARILAIAAAACLLSGCLLSPGKFTADMTVMRGGGFTFAYRGEIHLLGLSRLSLALLALTLVTLPLLALLTWLAGLSLLALALFAGLALLALLVGRLLAALLNSLFE